MNVRRVCPREALTETPLREVIVSCLTSEVALQPTRSTSIRPLLSATSAAATRVGALLYDRAKQQQAPYDEFDHRFYDTCIITHPRTDGLPVYRVLHAANPGCQGAASDVLQRFDFGNGATAGWSAEVATVGTLGPCEGADST
jgi:hypothetical protein